MALNPVNGLLYVSVPSAAGAPYGNSVVPVDPATGNLGTPIPVESEPDKLARLWLQGSYRGSLAATVSIVSQSSIVHGAGNAVLGVTGLGFVGGAGMFWNGAYRATTFVESGHLTFDVRASDVSAAGTATVTVINPGAAASNAVTVNVH